MCLAYEIGIVQIVSIDEYRRSIPANLLSSKSITPTFSTFTSDVSTTLSKLSVAVIIIRARVQLRSDKERSWLLLLLLNNYHAIYLLLLWLLLLDYLRLQWLRDWVHCWKGLLNSDWSFIDDKSILAKNLSE